MSIVEKSYLFESFLAWRLYGRINTSRAKPKRRDKRRLMNKDTIRCFVNASLLRKEKALYEPRAIVHASSDV